MILPGNDLSSKPCAAKDMIAPKEQSLPLVLGLLER